MLLPGRRGHQYTIDVRLSNVEIKFQEMDRLLMAHLEPMVPSKRYLAAAQERERSIRERIKRKDKEQDYKGTNGIQMGGPVKRQ